MVYRGKPSTAQLDLSDELLALPKGVSLQFLVEYPELSANYNSMYCKRLYNSLVRMRLACNL